MSSRAADIPRTPFAFDTVQFFIPTTIAKALDSLVVRERVTAGFIVEHITEIAERSSGPLLLDCVGAAQAALDAIAGKIAKR